MDGLAPGSSDRQNGANGRRLDNGRKGLAVIDSWALSEIADNPSHLVPLEQAIGASFVAINPFADDEISEADEKPAPKCDC